MAVYDQEIVDTTPQYLQSKSYSAQKFRTWFADIAQSGVFSDADFALSLLGGLAYRMSAGKAYIQGQQVADQGMYRMNSLANADLVVPTGHASLPTLHQVILRVMDNTHDGSGFNEGRIETVPGTPTAGATLENRSGAANLTTLGEASKNVLLVYDILMPAAAVAISAGNVRRRAQLAKIGFGIMSDTIPYLTVAEFQALREFPDGQEVYVLLDAAAGVVGHFRYRAGIADAYKWECIGGSPLTSFISTSEAITTGAWNDPSTVGPTLLLPLPGYYVIQAGARFSGAYLNGQRFGIGISIGATTPFVAHWDGGDDPTAASSEITTDASIHIPPVVRLATTAETLRVRYNGTVEVGTVDTRSVSAVPRRVSQ